MGKINKKQKSLFPSFSSDQTWFYIKKRNIVSMPKINFHWHDYCEIEFVISGEGINMVDGISYPLQRGSAYLLTPSSFHEITRNEQVPLVLYHVEFNNTFLESQLLQSVISCFNEEETEELIFLFQMLEKECNGKKKYCNDIIQLLLKQIIFLLLRNAFPHSEKTVQSNHIGKMIHMIHYRFREKLTLHELATECNLNVNYLGELFKETMGMSFHKYILNLRLKYAYSLLLNSNFTINEVCYESGFSSPSYFIKLFKEHFQTTPSRLREQKKEV